MSAAKSPPVSDRSISSGTVLGVRPELSDENDMVSRAHAITQAIKRREMRERRECIKVSGKRKYIQYSTFFCFWKEKNNNPCGHI